MLGLLCDEKNLQNFFAVAYKLLYPLWLLYFDAWVEYLVISNRRN